MLHILVVSGKCSPVGGESSGSLGIPSRTSSFGKQEKTLQGKDREGEDSQKEMEEREDTNALTSFFHKGVLTVHGSPERRSLGCGSGSASAAGRRPELPVPPGSRWRCRRDKGAPPRGALAADAGTPGGCGAGLAFCTCPDEARITLSFFFLFPRLLSCTFYVVLGEVAGEVSQKTAPLSDELKRSAETSTLCTSMSRGRGSLTKKTGRIRRNRTTKLIFVWY